MIKPIDEDQKRTAIQKCHFCPKWLHRSASIAHARIAHPIEYHNWIYSRADFGMSLLEAVGFRFADRPVIRS